MSARLDQIYQTPRFWIDYRAAQAHCDFGALVVAWAMSIRSINPATGEELESDRLKAKLGAALIERDLLHEKIAVLEANRPLSRRTFRP